MTISFSSTLWRWDGPSAWHFVTLPPELGTELRSVAPRGRQGFGSIPVKAACRGMEWRTSLFPDAKSQSYVLPVKAETRKRLALNAGDVMEIRLDLEI